MEETKKYEPLRLKPCLRSYLWGGTRLRGEYHKTGEGVIAESWELSVRADGQTYIDSGEHCGESLADVLRADPVGMAGTRCGIAPFPLLIKLIDARRDLSVQVHPSDETACREKGEQGKKIEAHCQNHFPQSSAAKSRNFSEKTDVSRGVFR